MTLQCRMDQERSSESVVAASSMALAWKRTIGYDVMLESLRSIVTTIHTRLHVINIALAARFQHIPFQYLQV